MNHELAAFPGQTIVDHNWGRDYAARNDRPWLSIKCMFGGAARYETDGGRDYLVDDGAFLTLNHGHAYTIEKYARTPIETFCIFFPPALAGEVADQMAISGEVIEQRHAHGGAISAALADLRQASIAGRLSSDRLEEELYRLLEMLFQRQGDLKPVLERLPMVRTATRLEMYRRVQWTRDYAHAHLDEPLPLARLAGVAQMSPYHFLRSFKLVAGVTPRVFVTNERMARAAELIARTDMAITDVCAEVGFASLPSFIHLFRRRFGCSPLGYRRGRNK